MNKTAELVRLWAEFEDSHKGADIEDFCQLMLIKKREDTDNNIFSGNAVPPDVPGKMAKMVGRISKLHTAMAIHVLKECGINNFEDFTFLNSIYKSMKPRKTDVINENFIELSSGLLILERLKNNGYILEEADDQDKRSKRLKMTKKGQAVLEKCYKRMQELNKEYFGGVPEEDLQLCIQLMSPIEIKLADIWMQNKSKSK